MSWTAIGGNHPWVPLQKGTCAALPGLLCAVKPSMAKCKWWVDSYQCHAPGRCLTWGCLGSRKRALLGTAECLAPCALDVHVPSRDTGKMLRWKGECSGFIETVPLQVQRYGNVSNCRFMSQQARGAARSPLSASALSARGAAGRLPAQLPASFVPDQLGSSSIKAAFVFTLFRGFWFHFKVWRPAQHQVCWSCGVVEQASGLISAGFGYHLWWEPVTGLKEWQIFKTSMNYNYLTTSESSPRFYSVFIPAVEWTLWFQFKAAYVSVSNQPGICGTIIGTASL